MPTLFQRRLISFVLALAPLVIWAGREGEVVFLLYRAPKDVAVQLAVWVLVALAVGQLENPIEQLRRAAAKAPLLLLLAHVGWSAASLLWATAPALGRANLLHWLTTALAAVAATALLEAGGEKIRRALIQGWCLAAGVLTLLALLQVLGLLPWLAPIDPEIAKTFPATLGWKNPAAHFIAAQIFLLAGLAFAAGQEKRPVALRLLLAGLLLAESFYLISLQSRTAWVGVGLGGLVVLVALPAPLGRGRRLGLAILMGVIVSAFLLTPAARSRAASLLDLATNPAVYLDTDRGQYLRTTLRMVEAHPFGVGLGSWQSEYPVHRVSTFGATAEFEVRQAHSDWVQHLGEGGFFGLAIWAAFWLTLLREAWRQRQANLPSLLLLAQVVTTLACGLTDYVVEMPLFRLYLAILVALVIARPAPEVEASPEESIPKNLRAIALLCVALLALLHLAWAATTTFAAWQEAALQAHSRSGRIDPARVFALTENLRRLPKATATEHRAFLFAASVALGAGELEKARRYLDLAAARSPFDPIGYQLRARLENLEKGPAEAQRWLDCQRKLDKESVDGHPEGCRPNPG